MDLTRRTLSKVPEITALFWVTKLLTTAMGESTSDYLVKRINPVVAVGLGPSSCWGPSPSSSGYPGTCRGPTGSLC